MTNSIRSLRSGGDESMDVPQPVYAEELPRHLSMMSIFGL